MNQPVLVRELAQDLTSTELQDLIETQTGGAIKSASEQAIADAKKISEKTLALFPEGDNLDFDSQDAVPFIRAILNEIATQDELNALTDEHGNLSQDGKTRVKRALFARAYGNKAAISRMSEAIDDNVKNATGALLNAAPFMSKIKGLMERDILSKYDFSPIDVALEKLSTLREQGMSLHDFLNQTVLFATEEIPQDVREVLQTFETFKRSQKKLTQAIRKIGQKIQEQGDQRQ